MELEKCKITQSNISIYIHSNVHMVFALLRQEYGKVHIPS